MNRNVKKNKYLNQIHIYKNRDEKLPSIKNTIKRFKRISYKLWVIVRFEYAKRKIYLTKNERKLASLKYKHKGERCFIIGNGPSLRIEDLSKLTNEITFAANKIYLAFEQTLWRPTYYAVTDSLVAKQNYDKINSLDGFVKLFPTYAVQEWGTPFDSSIYFKYIYYNTFPAMPGFSDNPMYGIYSGRTVIYPFIQLAFFMGLKEIYLIGIDFNFKEPKRRDKGILISEGEANHFHKQYRKPGEKWFLPRLDMQMKAFEVANEKAKINGIKIFNASRAGKLNIFPRINFNSLF